MIKKLLILFLILCSTHQINAQTDTTGYKVLDVIYLKEGGILRGEILSFDESTGGIVFKDEYGRKYSLGREQYKYFEEDQLIKVKNKSKERVIRPRKESGIGVNVGLKCNYIQVSQYLTADDYYLQGYDIGDLITTLTLGVGNHFSRQHYLAVNSEIKLLSSSFIKQYFNAGIRYNYQYDAQKGNVALYIPVELKYNQIKETSRYTVNDTTFYDGGTGYSYPSDEEIDVTLGMASLSVGHGFGFIMNNKKSFNIEMGLSKYFVLSSKYDGTTHGNPKSTFGGFGMNVSLLYNL